MAPASPIAKLFIKCLASVAFIRLLNTATTVLEFLVFLLQLFITLEQIIDHSFITFYLEFSMI